MVVDGAMTGVSRAGAGGTVVTVWQLVHFTLRTAYSSGTLDCLPQRGQ